MELACTYKAYVLLLMKKPHPLLSFLRRPSLPLCSIRHFCLHLFQLGYFLETLIKKEDAIVDQKIEKLQVRALLFSHSNLNRWMTD